MDARDFTSRVMQSRGPVLLLEPIQSNSRLEILRRLGGKVPIRVTAIQTVVDLESSIAQAIADFEAGEPRISLDIAVALLLMHKLDRNHMWAGNAKGYMWSDDIPNGRGLDQQYSSRLSVVFNALLQGDFLTFKTSKGKRKYALNPSRRPEIHEILRQRKFPSATESSLLRNKETESVRVLDALPEAEDLS